ncbi:hypothetical protein FEMY_21410 [Ferrovum myxofaciens]|uniref:GmrSD restriction endonucleases N-terminal domain-containing protein n=1 Tax=Ferrovum myxofaciens TaxID=416213 RepID=A0A149VVT7_9PROT|nr:DUF262 domain-containing protein [Ferrovum myxofaciens]KXW57332.1 hypothetical protein FEMY_21410 [Ferrovum myxofaciens]
MLDEKSLDYDAWPFCNGAQVIGMKLPEYLEWASNTGTQIKQLLLPPIQRGFVWKPKQIVDLWDSLLRGMPIGSLMLSKLSKGQLGDNVADQRGRTTNTVSGEAMGLLDGQQRTLAMLIGWPSSVLSGHCLWIDIAEKGYAGSSFALRLTTSTQPFGFERTAHGRLSRGERKTAREVYDKLHGESKTPDYDLFALEQESCQPRPWRPNSKPEQFVRVEKLWEALRKDNGGESEFLALLKKHDAEEKYSKKLYESFRRMESLEVPLILIPEHIGNSTQQKFLPEDAADPMVLLFERIGRNGASLSAEDLLFSMIKQQWPEAQRLVNTIHDEVSVRAFMSATDYVMTAFRLAAAEKKIADNPRPNPRDFHIHLNELLGKANELDKPLRGYLEKDSRLTKTFVDLYNILSYRKDDPEDIGIPLPMLPHLPRGLVQVLLRWIMLNPNQAVIDANRQKIISFSLFWFMNVWYEDKASKAAFEIVNKNGTFPAQDLYKNLIDAQDDQFGLALPIMPYDELGVLTDLDNLLSSRDSIFNPTTNSKQRELYKRFCWGRKPILLWQQRAYVERKFGVQASDVFAGLTDEDTVPYDYDHLCPQNHWGTDWRNIRTNESGLGKNFHVSRNVIGNCVGNLHVLESSLNRSFGDDSLAAKLKKANSEWSPEDSLLYLPELEKPWNDASPNDGDGDDYHTWHDDRIIAFQGAVFLRAQALYQQYYEVCKLIIPDQEQE